MKKLLIIVLALFNLTMAWGQSRNYFPFQDSTYYRVDEVQHCSYQYPYYIQAYYHYSFLGDTTINSLTYRKVYKSFKLVEVLSWTFPIDPPQSEPPCYAGSLREDTLNKEVYFVFPGSEIDSLLFDYKLNIGDTLRGHLAITPLAGNKPVLQSIDSVLIEGEYRRKWNFDQCNSNEQYFIEGVGASTGLIEPFCIYHILFTDWFLVCVCNNEKILYASGYNSEVGCTFEYVGRDEQPEAETAQISPNPLRTQAILDADRYLYNATFLMFDAFGLKVRQKDGINGQEILIDRNDFPPGVYFIVIVEDNRMVLKSKVLIVD